MNTSGRICSFILVLFFATASQGQKMEPAIVWENIDASYNSFTYVNPILVNSGPRTLYYDSYFFQVPVILERQSNGDKWSQSLPWNCGTGYKPHRQKFISKASLRSFLDEEFWHNSTVDDFDGPRFTQWPGYSGTGKYRLRFHYGLRKQNLSQFVSYSPEFTVTEKGR